MMPNLLDIWDKAEEGDILEMSDSGTYHFYRFKHGTLGEFIDKELGNAIVNVLRDDWVIRKTCFKILVTYNRPLNNVKIELDKETAKDLILYLIRSVLMDFDYRDGKSEIVGCYNAIPVEAVCGNAHSQHLMNIRNKLIELIDSVINKRA